MHSTKCRNYNVYFTNSAVLLSHLGDLAGHSVSRRMVNYQSTQEPESCFPVCVLFVTKEEWGPGLHGPQDPPHPAGSECLWVHTPSVTGAHHVMATVPLPETGTAPPHLQSSSQGMHCYSVPSSLPVLWFFFFYQQYWSLVNSFILEQRENLREY